MLRFTPADDEGTGGAPRACREGLLPHAADNYRIRGYVAPIFAGFGPGYIDDGHGGGQRDASADDGFLSHAYALYDDSSAPDESTILNNDGPACGGSKTPPIPTPPLR